MADLKYYDIILKPIVTERTMRDVENKKYVFSVHPDATKIQVREAVEKMFDGVKVESVNTMNLMGKIKRRGTKSGRRPAIKKAFVQLASDSKDLEIF